MANVRDQTDPQSCEAYARPLDDVTPAPRVGVESVVDEALEDSLRVVNDALRHAVGSPPAAEPTDEA